MPSTDEQPLSGGNATEGVVRVGDTVRRPAGPWTPAVHDLLTHLHQAGFPAAPRPLGIDEQGREVLTFAPGGTVWPDRVGLLDPDARLAHVARLVRDFHDAVADYTPPPDARWQVLIPDGGDEGPEIIAHHDLAPWNLVVDDGGGAGDGRWQWTFIDWDCAAPGSRLWDVAYAVHGFVPMLAHPHLRPTDAAARARLRIFADAYGLDEVERRRLVPMLARRTAAMYDFLRERAAAGSQPWATLWQQGHGDAWRNDTDWIAEREEQWTDALLEIAP